MKYIYAIADAPNAARAHVHRLAGITVEGDQVLLTINSYVNETSDHLIWQDKYEMPMPVFSGTTYPEGVLAWITSPNGLFPNGQLIDELDGLGAAQAKALALVKQIRDEKIHGGVMVENHGIFQTDPDAIRNIMGKSQRALIASIEADTTWMTGFRLMDNSMVPLTAEDMVSVGKALDSHIEGCYVACWAHEAAIERATSIEEIEAIPLYAGWPN